MGAPIEPTNPSVPFSPFIPATYSVPEEEDRRRTFLVDRFSEFADVINDKKIGTIAQATENFDGMKYWYLSTQKTRNGFHTLAYIPSFTNGLTLTRTSNPQFPIQQIDPNFRVAMTWGTANLPCSAVGANDGDYFSFMPKGDSRISYSFSDTQIVISTDGARASYSGFIFIQYIRAGS